MVTDQLVIVRGGGDIATGTIRTLRRAGFPVLILESAHPSAIRRTVALSEAVYEGSATVEDVSVTLAHNLDEAEYLLFQDGIAMLVDPDGAAIRDIIHSGEKYAEWDTGLTTLEGGGRHLFLTCVVDAGFTAGRDCDVVIETMRGHSLGRAITEGEALHNTGTPGLIAGHAQDRVIHSPAAGIVKTCAAIGDIVEEGQPIARIIPEESSPRLGEPGVPVRATFTGLLRGLIRDGYPVPEGFKIADIDPRASEHDNCFRISDKARSSTLQRSRTLTNDLF